VGASTKLARWPSYRVAVSVPPGSEKSFTVMVLQAPFGFGVELVDRGGQVVAGAPGPAPAAKQRVNVLLLSDAVGADAMLEALPQKLAEGLDVTQLRVARDFPDEALHLATLDAVVIDDFDTATMSAGQRRALQDYVSLGGSLVLAGGAGWSRVPGSLPAGMVPLRVSGNGPGSMGPLADLVGVASTVTAEVATGEMTGGRAVVAGLGGPPLVVTMDYHRGRVVQLGFDPLAEPVASDPVLKAVAWDQVLTRVAARGQEPASVGEDQVWAPALGVGARSWPSWPRPGVALLMAYALALGPAAFGLFGVSRRLAASTILVAVAMAGAVPIGLAGAHGETVETVVEVRIPGADGAGLTTSYRGMLALKGSGGVVAPPGAASTVFSASHVFGPVEGYVDPMLNRVNGRPPVPPVARGVGGGAVSAGGEHPAVRMKRRPWELLSVQTVSVDQAGPAIEATLGRVGEPFPPPSRAKVPTRLKGTVTNRSAVPVRQVQAQVQGRGGKQAVAHLTDLLGPGETKQVDAPILAFNDIARDRRPVPREEAAVLAASNFAVTGPGQVVVAAVTGDTTSTKTDRRHLGLVVTVGQLESDTSFEGPREGHLISALNFLVVGEMEVPSGAGPLSIHAPTLSDPSLRPDPTRPMNEVYNWTTGTWRPLPAPRPGKPFIGTPIRPEERAQGLVRYRSQVGRASLTGLMPEDPG